MLSDIRTMFPQSLMMSTNKRLLLRRHNNSTVYFESEHKTIGSEEQSVPVGGFIFEQNVTYIGIHVFI